MNKNTLEYKDMVISNQTIRFEKLESAARRLIEEMRMSRILFICDIPEVIEATEEVEKVIGDRK